MAETEKNLYGVMAEFDSADELLAATEKTFAEGYRKMDAYSPYPVHGLAEAAGFKKSKLPMIVLIGAIVGGILGFSMQYYASVQSYPLNIGGRPLNSWPSFIPITFELTILVAAFSAVLGMFALNGLPMPYHPVFNVPRFALASRDKFFLCVESKDPKFDRKETKKFLESLKARIVVEVDP